MGADRVAEGLSQEPCMMSVRLGLRGQHRALLGTE